MTTQPNGTPDANIDRQTTEVVDTAQAHAAYQPTAKLPAPYRPPAPPVMPAAHTPTLQIPSPDVSAPSMAAWDVDPVEEISVTSVESWPVIPWYQTTGVKAVRWVAAALGMALAISLGTLGLFANWFSKDIANTEDFAVTLSPLGRSTELRTAVTTQVGQAVEDYVIENPISSTLQDWTSSIDQFFDENPLVSSLAGLLDLEDALDISGLVSSTTESLAGYAKETAEAETEAFLESPEFPPIFRDVVRDIHTQILAAFAQPDTPPAASVVITLDAAPIVSGIVPHLDEFGYILQGFVPTEGMDIPIFELEDVGAAHTWYRLLSGSATGYFLVAVAALAFALLVAPRRWIATILLGTATALVAWFFSAEIPNYANNTVVELDASLGPLVLRAWGLLAAPLIEAFQIAISLSVAVGGLGAIGLGGSVLARQQT